MVTLTRSVAVQGRIDFADLNSERQCRFIAAYSQSKLANLMFAIEMDRRAKEAALPLASIAANPGTVMTSGWAVLFALGLDSVGELYRSEAAGPAAGPHGGRLRA